MFKKLGELGVKKMKDYITNVSICRRKFLFENFLKYSEKDMKVIGCKCCDLCSKTCKCSLCIVK